MQKLAIILFFIIPLSISSQTLNGKIYDAETTVKGALVVNISQNVMTYTNNEGDFKIAAKVKDTLYVSSLFHTKSLVEIKAKDFENIMIIEVKKIINELDAVLLQDEREKKFDSTEMEYQINNQIKEDIKRNPIKYGAAPSGNMDLLAIAKLIGSIFKRKNKPEAITPISYEAINSLFNKDRFFNKTLLIVDLNIPEAYHSLFFDYFEAKYVDSKLLKKEQQVNLLEVLVVCSQEFQLILKDAKKDP